jgi:hypothetical protein
VDEFFTPQIALVSPRQSPIFAVNLKTEDDTPKHCVVGQQQELAKNPIVASSSSACHEPQRVCAPMGLGAACIWGIAA